LSVDGSTNWPVFDKADDFNTQLLPEQAMEKAPGFCRLLEKLFEYVIQIWFWLISRAMTLRGLKPDCGRSVIPGLMEYNKALGGFRRIDVLVPFWGWPKSEYLIRTATRQADT
jgi:hypothetical protein